MLNSYQVAAAVATVATGVLAVICVRLHRATYAARMVAALIIAVTIFAVAAVNCVTAFIAWERPGWWTPVVTVLLITAPATVAGMMWRIRRRIGALRRELADIRRELADLAEQRSRPGFDVTAGLALTEVIDGRLHAVREALYGHGGAGPVLLSPGGWQVPPGCPVDDETLGRLNGGNQP